MDKHWKVFWCHVELNTINKEKNPEKNVILKKYKEVFYKDIYLYLGGGGTHL